MKNFLIFILVCLFSSSSYARFGATGGFNLSHYSASGSGAETEDYDMKPGFDIGAVYDHAFQSYGIISVELGYSVYRGSVIDSDRPTSEGDITFSYLVVRPLFHYPLQKHDLSLVGGFTLGLNAVSDLTYGSVTVDYDSVPGGDIDPRIALNFGLSYFKELQRFDLRPKLMYELGLTSVYERASDNYKLKVGVISLTLDVLFK